MEKPRTRTSAVRSAAPPRTRVRLDAKGRPDGTSGAGSNDATLLKVWHHSPRRGHQEIATEPLVRLFCILANRCRIRIVRLLAVMGEMPLLSVARATSGRMPQVSARLGRLASAGLVWRRRSGRRVCYCLAGQPGSRLVAGVLEALRRTFAIIGKSSLRRVARADRADSPTSSDAALFACFTAFTHARRLQVIRHLERQGSALLAEPCPALPMSQRACMRHLDKPDRRGHLGRRVRGSQAIYCLREGDGLVQQGALRGVRERLADMAG